MSDWEMVGHINWADLLRKKLPNKNIRMNSLIISLPDFFETNDSPMDISVRTCHDIKAKHKGPYTLLVSGGVDSQAMMLAWKNSGIPFRAVHYSYTNLNNVDTQTLHQFSLKHQIPVEIRVFDVLSYFKSDSYIKDACEYDCVSPHILSYIKFTSKHQETCIMSGNFIISGNSGLNWTILGLDRFRRDKKNNFVPFFFFNNPHIASCFDSKGKLSDELGVRVTDKDWYTLKCQMLINSGFDIIPQKNKMTGFEIIKEMYDSHSVPSHLRIKYAHLPSKRPFDLLLRYSLFDKLPLGQYSDITEMR